MVWVGNLVGLEIQIRAQSHFLLTQAITYMTEGSSNYHSSICLTHLIYFHDVC